jgi:NAD(P)-dependent dehydrogenase (short-subunit alcohol dehydrogenase family)
VNELKDKVAVITGGASGIGEATARLFVDEGARVVIADMQADRGGALADELGECARFIEVEVRQEAQVKSAIDLAVAEFGQLDCVFNNAGFGGVLGPIEDIPVDEFDLTMEVLVRGVFLGVKHAAPIMKAQNHGSIINTASIAGLAAGRGPHVYGAAKAAVIQLSKSVAMELAEHFVRVNAICPGYIATPLSANTVGRPDELIEKRIDGYAARQPIPRPGRPKDIAEMALWLASDRSRFVTGQAMTIDGGVITGAMWSEQKDVYKTYHPIKVYRPEG